MIYDTIKNFKEKSNFYFSDLPEIDRFFIALEEANYEIDKIKEMKFETLDLRFGEYETKKSEDVLFEAHRKLWDLQIVLEGEEYVEYAPIEEMQEEIPYDEGKDIAFYVATGEKIKIKRGNAVMLAPWDGHKPGINVDEQPQKIKKIVIKIERN
ncbi:MAG: YhcH/YjgK/YiaL family protein [Synergistaceae bacterium]